MDGRVHLTSPQVLEQSSVQMQVSPVLSSLQAASHMSVYSVHASASISHLLQCMLSTDPGQVLISSFSIITYWLNSQALNANRLCDLGQATNSFFLP